MTPYLLNSEEISHIVAMRKLTSIVRIGFYDAVSDLADKQEPLVSLVQSTPAPPIPLSPKKKKA
jgi:hypothetical protein